MSKKKFTIECEMEERWIDYFCTMLDDMQYNGQIGHSGFVAIYADGDGDFRPKFKFNTEFKMVKPKPMTDIEYLDERDTYYDAG